MIPLLGKPVETVKVRIRVQLLGHDLTAITEIWQDSLHNWNTVMDGYILFRKEARKARR